MGIGSSGVFNLTNLPKDQRMSGRINATHFMKLATIRKEKIIAPHNRLDN